MIPLPAAASSSDSRPVLLCFGDSITAHGRWVASAEAGRRWRLVNAGRAGRKTSDIATELPPALAGCPEATGLLLLLGVNDLPARDPRPGDQKIADCLAHLQAGLELAVARFARAAIFLVAPCTVDAGGLDALNRAKGYDITPPLLARLETGIAQLAHANRVQFFSLHGVLGAGHFSDGLHPNAAGDALIAQTVGAGLDGAAEASRSAFHLVGDSISIDYHDALEQETRGRYRYSRKGGLELARRDLDHPQGANGGDSSAVLEYLREQFQASAELPGTVVVNCGLHDIKTNAATGERQVPLADYRRNLEAIVALVHGSGRRLVWVTTTPVDEVRHQARSPGFHRYERDLADYNAVAAEIMEARGVPVIDLHAFTAGLAEPKFRDHVHFVPEVSRRQAEFLRAALDALPWPGNQRSN